VVYLESKFNQLDNLFMGAWGYGLFEDDSALDFMADIEESGNASEVIQRAFFNAR
jgi:hypothetical protein